MSAHTPGMANDTGAKPQRTDADDEQRQYRRLLGSLGREPIPELLVETAAKLMAADDASLLLSDDEQSLYLAHSCGPAAQHYGGHAAPLAQTLAGRVALTRRPALLAGSLAHDELAEFANSRPYASSIVYPLICDERLLGVMTLNRARGSPPFDEADLERAALLATNAALTLDIARRMSALITVEKLATLGQLASSLVHEINNPLASLLANVGFIRDELDSAQQGSLHNAVLLREALTDVENGIGRIQAITADVRVMARADSRGSAPFDVGDAVRAAMRIAQNHLSPRTELRLSIEPRLAVSGNSAQLGQVVLALVANADEAMSAAEWCVRYIDIVCRREGGVVLEVIDTGPGIESARLAQIFAPFASSKPGGRGVGLGLFVCRDIIAQHGGDICVRSERGRGTTVTITLPALCEAASEAV